MNMYSKKIPPPKVKDIYDSIFKVNCFYLFARKVSGKSHETQLNREKSKLLYYIHITKPSMNYESIKKHL